MTKPIAGVNIVDRMGTISKAAPKPKNPRKNPPRAMAMPQPIKPHMETSAGSSKLSSKSSIYKFQNFC